MMQNGDRIAVAVRRQSDDEILIRDLPARFRFKKLGRIPFLRGLFRLYDMMSVGLRALNLSTELAFPEDEQMGKGGTFITFAIAIIVAIGAFMILPLYLTGFIPGLASGHSIAFNLVEGLIRMGFFFAYLIAISRMKALSIESFVKISRGRMFFLCSCTTVRAAFLTRPIRSGLSVN